jgi:ABC-2 type transport system permease protein
MSLFKKNTGAEKPEAAKESLKVRVDAAARRHSSRRGAFSAGIVALAVVAVVVFNLVIGQLPDTATQFDMTNSKIYNISQTSVDYLDGMKDDVVIHVLADKKSVDTRIVRFLNKYVQLSDHLSLEYVNPTVHPAVLTKYGCDANTIVVTCGATSRQETISIGDIIGYDEMSYYTTGSQKETSFDAEGLLTSAVDGVLTDASYHAYETTGHGETAMPASVTAQFKKSHISVDSVNLLTDGGIPDSCNLLILNAPTADLADDELTMLEKYLAKGGQVIYCMAGGKTPESLPNFKKLCAEYGMAVADGLIADTQRCYQDNPYLFFPQLDNTVDAAAGVASDATILFYAPRGVTLTKPARSTITVHSFLTTSESGYSVVDETNKTKGTYVVGAVATETVDDNTAARFTVYGSDSLINSDILQSFTNIGNSDLFMSSATCGFKDLSAISIDPVSLEDPTNTITTGGIWAILFIFVIPVAALITGFVRWMRRRRL